MTVGTAWPYNSAACDRARGLPFALPQRVVGGAVLTCIALSCAWALCVNLGGGADDDAALRGDELAVAASRADRLAIESRPAPASSDIDIGAFDARFSAAFPPGVFLGTRPFAADESVASPDAVSRLAAGSRVAELTHASAPLSLAPPWRRHGRLPLPEAEQQSESVASAQPEEPSLFERIFGRRSQSAIFTKLFGPPPSKVTLAYAEDGAAGDGTNVTTGLYDRQTAVYDISAHMVYLPNGTALEAHSGFGTRLDDPGSAAVKDLGVTPPDIYDLQPRGALFHGVHALRLLPEDQTKVFGRAGLLAHTYMLGPNGQSNGCVSFKDYDAFLQAYENHQITRLAVVSRVD